MRVYAHYNVVQNQKRPLEVEERVKQVDKRQKVDKPVKEDKDALYKRQLDKLAKKNPNLYSLLEESDLVERVLNVGKNAASKEEDLLKDLEKKLGIKDKKKLQKSFGADGLDDLLSGIQVGSRDVNDAAAEAEEESGSEQGSMEETFDIQESDADTESEQGSMEEEFDMDGSDSDDGSTQESETSAAQEAPVAVGKYIPPSMRAKPTTKSEQQLVVARKLQGLINRLSESNIESIVNDIESLYQQYPRNDVTSTWTDILLQSITSTAFVNDELVVVYACLVSCLYALIGVDAAAHFVQTVMESFLSKYAAVKNEPQDGVKHCTNVVALLAELYNFGVVSNVLAYDLIRTWIDHLNELSVELLLKLLRCMPLFIHVNLGSVGTKVAPRRSSIAQGNLSPRARPLQNPRPNPNQHTHEIHGRNHHQPQKQQDACTDWLIRHARHRHPPQKVPCRL
jgi:nucleolar MIF4G domain-containing protein 1